MKKYIFRNFVFTRPKKYKILFYDDVNSLLIKKKLNKKDYTTLHVRGEKLNIIVLIKMFLNFKFNSKNYIYHYIKCVQPKIVITCIDNDYNFYTLKEKFPRIIFIAIQGGYRNQYNDFFTKLKSLKKNKKLQKLKADYIFLYGSAINVEYLRYIKFKPIFLGSYRNNFVPIIKNKEKKNTVLFISSFRQKIYLQNNEFFRIEEKLLPLVQSFCFKYNLKFSIIGSSRVNRHIEKNYFSKILSKNNLSFIKRKSLLSNFKIVDKHELIIFIDSTLGYESIARNKKIAAFCTRINNNFGQTEVFSWAQKLKKKGFFYSDLVSKKEVFRVLKNVTSISKTKWRKNYSKIFEEIMNFDLNNKKLFNIIKKHT